MAGWVKEFIPFPSIRISPKVNVIARLEFEPAYNDVKIQYVNYYPMGPPLLNQFY